MTSRTYVHVDPATGYADPADLGSGGAGAGAKVLADNHTFIDPPSGSPSGAAGGDLSGTYPNPSVVDDSHSHSHDTTITGVSANDHHNEDHVLADGSALGTHHTTSGLTAGWVLRATAATAAKFMQLVHGDLGSVGANDHHNRDHASTHGPAAADALKLDDLASPDDNTDLNASTSAHGLLRKLDNIATHFLAGDGSWGTPAGTGAVASDTIWDTKGDLAVATAADTAQKLAAGANDTILMADSAQTTGLKWVAPATPVTQAFGDVAAEGTSDDFSRGSHVHGMPNLPAQDIGYPQSFSGDTIDGSSTTPFVDVSAFDTKEVLNSKILHLQTKGASKDQSVRVTLGTTKAGAFDVRIAIAAWLMAWSTADNNTYADVLLRTSGGSTICGARLQGFNEALGTSGLHWPHIRPKMGGSSFSAWDDNLDPSVNVGEALTLRFLRDGSNVITFWVGRGTLPAALAKTKVRSNYVPYTQTVSGTLARIEFSIHTPSGPGSTVEYDLWIPYVSSV